MRSQQQGSAAPNNSFNATGISLIFIENLKAIRKFFAVVNSTFGGF